MSTTTTSDRLIVARTILAQLGGNRFLAMTGAKSLVGSSNSLTFKLPSRFAKQNINVVRITLTPADTYTVEFGKLWGTNYRTIATHEDVYCDNLRDVFTSETGLDTHF